MLQFLFNKDAGLQVCNSIKKRLQHRCFLVKFAKFLRTPFLKEPLRWLLLEEGIRNFSEMVADHKIIIIVYKEVKAAMYIRIYNCRKKSVITRDINTS